MNENILFKAPIVEVATYKNYKEATFLLDVLGEPDLYNRIIPEDAGEKYHKTIIGFPLVAKLKKNIFGQESNFSGHEEIKVKARNGKVVSRFNTMPIGSFQDAYIEEREIDGYEGKKKCIMAKCKLWVQRFPEYYKVFDKLYESGELNSSWEMTVSESEEKDGFKYIKKFEFISNCLLGTDHTPAVPGAGCVEYASFTDYDSELADALEKDMANLDINETDLYYEPQNIAKEVAELANINTTTTVDNNQAVEPVIQIASQEPNEPVEPTAATASAEPVEPVTQEPETTATASLTQNDLYEALRRAYREREKEIVGDKDVWSHIALWYPEDHIILTHTYGEGKELDFKQWSYEVNGDEVTVSDPIDVTLVVSVREINDVVAEKDKKIGELTAELEIKNDAVIKASEKINSLNVQVSELEPYKAQVEAAEAAKIEAEIAEKKSELKNNLVKTNLFTEEEIASTEIAEMIESRNEAAIKNLIADRYIASLNKEPEVNTASLEPETNTDPEPTVTASLETDDEIDEDACTFMGKLLKR